MSVKEAVVLAVICIILGAGNMLLDNSITGHICAFIGGYLLACAREIYRDGQ